jgi:hypothetical protein
VARFSTVPRSEARMLVLPPRRATQEQYREYVRQLTADEAGRLELGPGDRSITERARLKAAARAEGVGLHIQRQGDTIVFWLMSEEPKAAAPRAGGRQSKR